MPLAAEAATQAEIDGTLQIKSPQLSTSEELHQFQAGSRGRHRAVQMVEPALRQCSALCDEQ
jgi:hypothetical protein